MAEQDTIFSSSIKYSGLFSFASFYKFCYDWLSEEAGLDMSEGKYVEKISGDSKNIDIGWSGGKALSDYFKFQMSVGFSVSGLKDVEVAQNGAKIKTNSGGIKVSVKGVLIRDYQGKFEMSAFNKFLRSIYEKWVITSRIDEMEGKIAGACDEFMAQTKAYLDLEGKR
jgi:hypothetical protein